MLVKRCARIKVPVRYKGQTTQQTKNTSFPQSRTGLPKPFGYTSIHFRNSQLRYALFWNQLGGIVVKEQDEKPDEDLKDATFGWMTEGAGSDRTMRNWPRRSLLPRCLSNARGRFNHPAILYLCMACFEDSSSEWIEKEIGMRNMLFLTALSVLANYCFTALGEIKERCSSK